MSRGRIVIVGGSMAGLFAAVALRARGFEVSVHERAGEALANRGAGIATHRELYDAVRTAGIELRDEMGVESRGRILFDRDGSIRHTHEMPQIMTSWGLIYRFLRAQVADDVYHGGATLSGIEPAADGVTAVFADGQRVAADWLIGADGARSTVRALVAPEIVPAYVGYFGWRGLFDEARVPPAVLQQVAERMAFGMAPGGHWLGYLVAGPDDDLTPGRRWYNWGWYRTADADSLRDHLTDAAGVCHEAGIPHHLIRPELVEAMRAEARASLAPQIQAIVDATPQPFLQGMFDFASERLVHDRVILIGDAAATARPHVGMGVSKAAEDASTLAAALAEDTLDEWQAARLRYAHAVVAWGRDLGSYIGPQPDDPAHRTRAAHFQRPEVLLAATAATNPAAYLGI
ncbi:MAG: FAD-dependent monooxygenase [Gammaproteobacteria bacterium]|nr:FAD-dependent monooxygenase [Gammaproteobacteria bacterium]